jgi:hypothetical protein
VLLSTSNHGTEERHFLRLTFVPLVHFAGKMHHVEEERLSCGQFYQPASVIGRLVAAQQKLIGEARVEFDPLAQTLRIRCSVWAIGIMVYCLQQCPLLNRAFGQHQKINVMCFGEVMQNANLTRNPRLRVYGFHLFGRFPAHIPEKEREHIISHVDCPMDAFQI